MLKYCVDKWYENNHKLLQALQNDKELKYCEYEYLLRLVIEHILNQGVSENYLFNQEAITVVDNGDYGGTQMFLFPRIGYEPCAGDYLLTFIEYGSCPYCDALEHVHSKWGGESPSEEQLQDFMLICKDLVCNMVKPYNEGWREDSVFSAKMEEEVRD